MSDLRLPRYLASIFLICSGCLTAANHVPGSGLPSAAWEAGTKLAEIPHGGRITTFHRGLLYLGGTDNQGTWIYDISNPQAPQLRCNGPSQGNSHVWYKVGDLFFRQDLATWSVPAKLQSLAVPSCTRVPWTTSIHNFPLSSQIAGDDWMPTYPYAFTDSVLDARVGWWPPVATRNLLAEAGILASNRFRIGNLLFFTPGDGQRGVAVFDIGDPANPRLLDVLSDNFQQYTTAWHVWRHYLVMMIGHNENGPDRSANALVIDFSDPTDLRISWTIARDQLPGRYVHFQDHYAFAGHVANGRAGGQGVKYNMITRTVERAFSPPNTGTDFQWIPLGHLLLVSGSETNGSASTLYTHQDGLDVTPPSVAYHLPANGAINQPRTSAIGLVIHERLDATTVNENTIQLRPIGGEPVPAIVMHTSYDVVNVIPVAPLQADTNYEVRLVANGIRDVAGNGIEPYSFFFSTGNTVQEPPEIVSISMAPAGPARVGQTLQFDVDATGANEYSWTFGDGTPATPWTGATRIGRTYSRPGIYTVSVQARGAGGQVASATSRVVVDPVASISVPSSSTSILVASDRVWVLNPDQGSVAVFNAQTLQRLAEHPVCDDPRSLARDDGGRIWIACRGDDRLVGLESDGRPTALLSTGYGSAPGAILFGGDGSKGYATLTGTGQVLRFSASNATEEARVTLGFEAESLARAGDRLYIARLKSSEDSGRIAVLDLDTFRPRAGEPGNPGIGLALDSTTTDSGTAGRGLPNYVASLAVSPDNSNIWYAAKKDNVLRGLSREGTELDFEKTVRVLIGAIDTSTGAERVDARLDIDNGALALALLPSPGGSVLFVALAGNDRIVALDPWQGAEIARVDTGAAPRGLAIDTDRNRLWVRNDLGRSVTVIDIGALVGEGAPTMPVLGTESSVTEEVLTPEVLTGKRIFYRAEDPRMSADGYIACASCHLDGGSDDRVWDFTQRGEGLRRTIPLLGRSGMGHGPLHWTANFDEVQDFEHDIRENFAGTGFMSDIHFHSGRRDQSLGAVKAGASVELDALAAYVASLDRVGRSPYRDDLGDLSASAAAGRAVFDQLGCARCHGGVGYTDSPARRWHDVGTVGTSDMRAGRVLQGLDTPTLRGLWRQARFLHDARAADPLAALATIPSGRHGNVASLSSIQRQQLHDYLLSIDDSEPASANSFELRLMAPSPGTTADPGRPMQIDVATDLEDIERLDILLDNVVAASLTSAPWRADIQLAAGSRPELQLRATHVSGSVSFAWPQQIAVHDRVGGIFGDDFETQTEP